MNLFQIALHNLRRRKGKIAFMLVGLTLASAAVVSIFSLINAMQREISEQLSDIGANLVITADRGELTFQYGGITIPELIFDAATLTQADLEVINALDNSYAIIAIAPKLIGTASTGDTAVVVAGVDLAGEFALKPWLKLHEIHDGADEDLSAAGEAEANDAMDMSYAALNLDRIEAAPDLKSNEVLIGANLAAQLSLSNGDTITLDGVGYLIAAVLEETGMMEDSKILMHLSEAQTLFSKPEQLTVIEIAANFNRISEEALVAQLSAAMPHSEVTSVRQAVMGRNELLNTLTHFGLLAGSMVIVAGMLIVALTMLASVRERTRELGIFSAIGFRSRDIFKIIAFEVLIISLVGGAAGYHLGLEAARLAAPLLTETTLSSTWELSVFMQATVLTAITGMLAGLIPAIKAASLNPAEALRFI